MAETGSDDMRRRSASPKRTNSSSEYDSVRREKFRFKSSSSSKKSSSSSSRRHGSSSHSHSHRDRDRSSDRHRHHHHHHHRSKKHKSSSSSRLKDNPADYDDTYVPNCRTFNFADPETSFRESLFDAMADDEGAQFWEGVYGQPIHEYTRPQVENGKGELEMMDDDEYATYVRGKMYEKSHEHIILERQKREEERIRKKKEEEEARKEWQRQEYERLAREKARRQKKRSENLRNRWTEYQGAWEKVTRNNNRPNIPWPVDSGSRKDVSKENVGEFFKSATSMPGSDTAGSSSSSLVEVLRVERVRWHPDKAMQRWGRDNLSEEELQGITAVFQAVDSLWAEVKPK